MALIKVVRAEKDRQMDEALSVTINVDVQAELRRSERGEVTGGRMESDFKKRRRGVLRRE